MALVPITDSPNLEPVPAIGDAVVLTPSSFASWSAMFAAHPSKDDYLLTPGDYAGWGTLHINDRSGTAQRPRTFRYHNPTDNDEGTHPCKRANEALVGGIRLARVSTSSDYWLFHGLTRRGTSAEAWVAFDADHVTWDFCLIEDSDLNPGIRSLCSYVTVQRCVIRNSSAAFGEDRLGFQAEPFNKVATGIKCLDNEIYNYGDSFGVPNDVDEPLLAIDFLVEGNDFYQDGSKYFDGGRQSDSENAIDVKAGSDTVQSVIRGNRMWGFRRNGFSSPGDVLTLHQYYRNLLVEDNIMGEGPIGVRSVFWPNTYEDQFQPRRLVVRNNQIYGVRRYHPDDVGTAALWSEMDMDARDNTIARCDYVIQKAPVVGYRAGGPTFSGNTRIATKGTQEPGSAHPNPYDDADNIVGKTPPSYFAYQRKRWTGPEWVEGALPKAARKGASLPSFMRQAPARSGTRWRPQ